MEEALLLPLAQIGVGDVAAVGAKAANLGEMLRAGIPVPRGFCLTTAAFQCHAAAVQLGPALAELAGAAPGTSLDHAGSSVRARLVSAPMPLEIQQAILLAWEQLLGRAACAVRSSATAEDLPGASFAGQLDTLLNVCDPPALLHAVQHCWASLFSARALAYRTHQGFDHDRVSMAVVVQELVAADAAGVLFTVNPLSGRTDEMLVEVSVGLGESVVSGRVSPDRYVLRRGNLEVVERTLSAKELAVVPAAGGGVRELPLAMAAAGAAAVTDSVVQRVAALGMRAERLFGAPQDVEFAVAAGEVLVLQARPVTTRAVPAPAEDRQVWTNMNAGEVLPDVLSPLTRSLLERTLLRCFEDLLGEVGFAVHGAPLIGFIAGRAYFNLNTIVALVRALPGGRHADITGGFGGMHGLGPDAAAVLRDNPPRIELSRLQLVRRVPRWILWACRHMSMAGGERERTLFARRLDACPRRDLAAQSPAALRREIETLVELFDSFMRELLGYMACGMGPLSVLDQLGNRWRADDPKVGLQLLASLGGMASAEAGLDMWRLAALAHQDAAVEAVLLGADHFDAARDGLAALESGAAFLARWEDFMLRHGHHARGEVELRNARWADDPDYVLAQVRTYLRHIDGKDPVAAQRAQAEVCARKADEIRRRLRNPVKRALFNFLLPRAQHAILYRENTKSEGVRLIALLRWLALEIGRRAAARGSLDRPDDVFFLSLDELSGVIDGISADGSDPDTPRRPAPRALVADRRAAFEREQALVPPGTIVGRFNGDTLPAEVIDADVACLTGLGVSPGVVSGAARVILHADVHERVLPGEILVAPFTDPGWTPYFQLAAGLVTDLGGSLSHGSIVAREYGLPAVVNVANATRRIRTGDRLQIDGTRGEVRILR